MNQIQIIQRLFQLTKNLYGKLHSLKLNLVITSEVLQACYGKHENIKPKQF